MRTTTSERVHLNLYVDRDVREQLERIAIEGDRSLSAEVRRALARHIERAAIPDPEEHTT